MDKFARDGGPRADGGPNQKPAQWTTSIGPDRACECDRFNVEKGVRQGCILSPYLFNLYSEMIMRKAGLENMEEGAKVGDRKINNLRYADDTTLLAENQDHLKRLLKRVKDESKKAGLALNIKKTNIMSSRELRDFVLDDEQMEVVDRFILLGSMIN